MPRWKRPLDVTLSLVLLVLLSPVWLLAALAVRCSSRGPVLFRQERVGLLMRRFYLFKFRTMYHGADQEVHRRLVSQAQSQGAVLKKLDAERDQRVTRVGRFMRLTCVDEIPQLLNVLRGEMSLVGPRPCIPYELETYKPWYVYRFECLPGMTGLWQVSGKNRLTPDQMMRLDIRYARRQTPGRDLWIMLKTPWAIVRELWFAWRRPRLDSVPPAFRPPRVALVPPAPSPLFPFRFPVNGNNNPTQL